MCDDCQCYAHYLEKAEGILDANGGTNVFQMTPAQIEITSGAEQLQCVRLHEKGLVRWHTACCRTPIANTFASPKMPFAGVLHSAMDHEGDGRAREEVLGPILVRVQGRFGYGEMPNDAYARAPLSIIIRSLKLLFKAWRSGAHQPSPFFDEAGSFAGKVVVLSVEERDALRSKLGGSSM